MARRHLKGLQILLAERSSVGVDPKILARSTPGFSGADLQNMVKCVAGCYINILIHDTYSVKPLSMLRSSMPRK